jgi:two-component system response regulator AtoC
LPEHLLPRIRDAAPRPVSPESAELERLDEIERLAIQQALRQHGGNRTESAKSLGISRRALLYKLQRFREAGFKME